MSDIRKYFTVQPQAKNNMFKSDCKTSNNLNNNLNDNLNNNLNNKIIVFTDGSTFNNGKKNMKQYGGIGIFFNNNSEDNISQILNDDKITNNVAELTACLKAIEIIINKPNFNYNNQIVIYTDSEYTINCITKWASGWKNNGWKRKQGSKLFPVKNCELIKNLYNYHIKYKVIFKHVRSHQTPPSDTQSSQYKLWYGNMMADKLATQASLKSMNN